MGSFRYLGVKPPTEKECVNHPSALTCLSCKDKVIEHFRGALLEASEEIKRAQDDLPLKSGKFEIGVFGTPDKSFDFAGFLENLEELLRVSAGEE